MTTREIGVVFDELDAKVASGALLNAVDAAVLWSSPDLVRIGMLGEASRRRRHGDRATFVRVFDAAEGGAAVPPAAGELRVQDCPATPDEAVALVRALVTQAGATPVTAYALPDLERVCGTPARLADVLAELAEAGLAAIAEMPVDTGRDGRPAIDAVLAAGLGIARFTVRQAADPLASLEVVRRLHKATGAVRGFAPLPRDVDATRPTTGFDDAKRVALARLTLDVASIQVDWQRYGPKLAQVALLFGADDVDGVSPVDDTGEGRRRAPLEEVTRNIRAASLVPVERDGRFALRQS